MILGVEDIHKRGLIHRDIKPENILLDHNGYARITDFGISQYQREINFCKKIIGTLGYMAPETILKRKQSYNVDYFSIGILTYELLFGDIPYQGDNISQAKEFFISQEIKMNVKSSHAYFSPEVYDFINSLIKRKPKKRLGYFQGINELKQHKWFKHFNWNALKHFKLKAPFIPSEQDNYYKNFSQYSTGKSTLTDAGSKYTPKEINEMKQMKFLHFTYIKSRYDNEEEKNQDDLNTNNLYNLPTHKSSKYNRMNNFELESDSGSDKRNKRTKRLKLFKKSFSNVITPSRNVSNNFIIKYDNGTEDSKCCLPDIHKSYYRNKERFQSLNTKQQESLIDDNNIKSRNYFLKPIYSLRNEHLDNINTSSFKHAQYFHFDVQNNKPFRCQEERKSEYKSNIKSFYPYINDFQTERDLNNKILFSSQNCTSLTKGRRYKLQKFGSFMKEKYI